MTNHPNKHVGEIVFLSLLIGLLASPSCGSKSIQSLDASPKDIKQIFQPDGSDSIVTIDLSQKISDGILEKDVAVVTPKIGDSCTASTPCPSGGSGNPTCRESWPGGYCLVEGCSTH